MTFVSANVHKIPAGGWFPLLVGPVTLTLMLVWRKGRQVAWRGATRTPSGSTTFIAGLAEPDAPLRMRGTAIYLTKQAEIVPAALALNVKHNGVVHERVILLKVTTERSPRVPEDRIVSQELTSGFRSCLVKFGFAEKPDVMAALNGHRAEAGCDPDRPRSSSAGKRRCPPCGPTCRRGRRRCSAS